MTEREQPDVYRWVHTCNVTACRNAVTLQVTDTIRIYKLNFHPVPHGVNVSCERYKVRFRVCYWSPSDIFAASSGFVHLYTLCFKEKDKRAAGVTNATVHKQESVQRFKFAGRLEFSVSGFLHSSTGLFISFPSSSHASCFQILLKCIWCSGSQIIYFLL